MLTTNAYVIYKSLELNSVTNAIFNFQSQVGAIPIFSCKSLCGPPPLQLQANIGLFWKAFGE